MAKRKETECAVGNRQDEEEIFLVSKPIVYGLAIAYLLNPIVKADKL